MKRRAVCDLNVVTTRTTVLSIATAARTSNSTSNHVKQEPVARNVLRPEAGVPPTRLCTRGTRHPYLYSNDRLLASSCVITGQKVPVTARGAFVGSSPIFTVAIDWFGAIDFVRSKVRWDGKPIGGVRCRSRRARMTADFAQLELGAPFELAAKIRRQHRRAILSAGGYEGASRILITNSGNASHSLGQGTPWSPAVPFASTDTGNFSGKINS